MAEPASRPSSCILSRKTRPGSISTLRVRRGLRSPGHTLPKAPAGLRCGQFWSGCGVFNNLSVQRQRRTPGFSCRVSARTRTLAAWTPPVQPVRRPALLSGIRFRHEENRLQEPASFSTLGSPHCASTRGSCVGLRRCRMWAPFGAPSRRCRTSKSPGEFVRSGEVSMTDRMELLEAAFDSFPEGMGLFGGEDEVVFWNQAAQGITGYPAVELLGRQLPECLEPLLAAGSGKPEGIALVGKEGGRRSLVQARHKLGHAVPVMARVLFLR